MTYTLFNLHPLAAISGLKAHGNPPKNAYFSCILAVFWRLDEQIWVGGLKPYGE
jgi:hypothetical protein